MDVSVSKNRNERAEVVLAALLRGRTVKEAAEECGMGYRTLKYWLASDWFKSDYEEAKRLLLDTTINALRTAGGEGVAALRDVANNRRAPAGARATAGRALLEILLRAVEVQDITARLERLEAAMSQGGGNNP